MLLSFFAHCPYKRLRNTDETGEVDVPTGEPVRGPIHNINQLPSKCLRHIFAMLTPWNQLRVREVCKWWKATAEYGLGLTKSLYLSDELLVEPNGEEEFHLNFKQMSHGRVQLSQFMPLSIYFLAKRPDLVKPFCKFLVSRG